MEDDGHIINLDGRGTTEVSEKYRSERLAASAGSGTGRLGSAFQMTQRGEDENGQQGVSSDRVSVVSGTSGRSKTTSQLEVKLPWYKGITCKDIKDIMPTLLILFIGLGIMVLVIPYAFASVIKQLEAEHQYTKENADNVSTMETTSQENGS